MSEPQAVNKPPETQAQIVKRQFGKNRPAVWSLYALLLMFLGATYAPVIALDVPFFCGLEDAPSFPWVRALFDPNVFPLAVDTFFNVLIFTLPLLALVLWKAPRKQRRWLILGVVALQFVAFGVLSANLESFRMTPRNWSVEIHEKEVSSLFPPFRHHPNSQRSEFSLTPPFERGQLRPGAEEPPEELWPYFLLGSDNLGNDVFTRVLYGTRISLTIGIVAVALYVSVGIFLGGLAGYFGGWVDDTLMFCAQVVMTIPGLFLILFIISIIDKPTIFHIMGIIALLNWPTVLRLVRGEFLRQREIDYVAAGKALGYSPMRIMFRHIAPNSMAPVFVSATFGVAGAILIESTISFLGLGDVDAPSWGQLLKIGNETSSAGRHLVWIAGSAIFAIVLILNLIGEGLRDALDPKLRK